MFTFPFDNIENHDAVVITESKENWLVVIVNYVPKHAADEYVSKSKKGILRCFELVAKFCRFVPPEVWEPVLLDKQKGVGEDKADVQAGDDDALVNLAICLGRSE